MSPIDVLKVFCALLKCSSESVSVPVKLCAIVSIGWGERKLATLFICCIGVEDAAMQTGNDTATVLRLNVLGGASET